VPAPLVLGFDLAAAHCAAALLCGDAVLAAAEEPALAAGQDARLMPFLAEVLAAGGAGWRDLAAVAVGTGPGGHSGLRIAVAAARGLALGLGVPALGVSRFEVLAFGGPRPMLAAVAGRGGPWVARIGPDGAADAALPAGEAGIEGTGLDVAGAEAGALAALTGGRALALALPVGETVARIAAARLASGQAGPRPAPCYLRPPDAAPAAAPPPLLPAVP
jgi:tRNA threonylcarbamoyl adenosine modification protein YeaZ